MKIQSSHHYLSSFLTELLNQSKSVNGRLTDNKMFFTQGKFKITCNVVLYFFTQGVLQVRKRVTLMIVTVSAIFGVTWFPDLVLHVVEQTTSLKFSPAIFAIVHTIIMFNSAVNPFAYALINQRFREKMKRLLCYSVILLEPKSCTNSQSHRIELMNSNITQLRP